MKIRAIILDCDGVILDSNKEFEKLYEMVGKNHGVNLRAGSVYKYFGQNPKEVLRKIFGTRNVESVYDEYVSYMKNPKFLKRLKAFPGARAAITGMKKKYKVAVASGAVHTRLRISLSQNSLLKYFDTIVSGEEVKRGKPAPDILYECMKNMKVKKGETIYVGDAPSDLIAAKRAGVKFVAVLTGVLDRKTAKSLGADYIVSDITMVRELVEKINNERKARLHN